MTARKKAVIEKEVAVVTKLPPTPTYPAAQSEYTGMIRLGVEHNVGIETIERLVALQNTFTQEEARKAFFAARSGFQSAVPVITKQGRADYGEGKAKYQYAKLEDIADGIRPYLHQYGLSYSWSGIIDNGMISVTCTLSHVAGHSESSTMISTPDNSGGKAAIHQIASARSYLRRYTLMDVTGVICAGEDDDAHQHIEEEAQAPADPEYCSDAKFSEMSPKWIELIKSGKKTSGLLVKWLEGKGVNLTPAQIAVLNEVDA